MRIGSLCTGAGQLDMAAALLFPDGVANTVWACETDPDASVVIDHRVCRVNHGDITTVDWRKVEPIDVLVAGYPCQDFSNAGKRAGMEGARGALWFNVADAIRVLRPRLVLLENVRAHLARGFGRVLGDLADLGYDAQWTCLRASDVGACHQRDRVFIVATPADPDREPVRIEPQRFGARHGAAVVGGDREDALMPTPTAGLGRGAGMPSVELAAARMADGRRFLDDAVALLPTRRATDAAKGGPNQRGSSGDLTLPSAVALLPTPAARVSGRGSGYGEEPGRPLSETVVRLLPTPTATRSRNATSGRTKPPATARTNFNGWTLDDVVFADRWAQYGPAIRRWEQILGRCAPEPTVTGKRGGQRLSGVFTEWMMGWPEGWASGLVDNNAAVRLSGNGVVTQQAFAAYVDLTSHLRAA